MRLRAFTGLCARCCRRLQSLNRSPTPSTSPPAPERIAPASCPCVNAMRLLQPSPSDARHASPRSPKSHQLERPSGTTSAAPRAVEGSLLRPDTLDSRSRACGLVESQRVLMPDRISDPAFDKAVVRTSSTRPGQRFCESRPRAPATIARRRSIACIRVLARHHAHEWTPLQTTASTGSGDWCGGRDNARMRGLLAVVRRLRLGLGRTLKAAQRQAEYLP